MASKQSKSKFQLTPKHLVTATLGVCAVAIIAVIIGVIGTFNPRDTKRGQEQEQEKNQTGEANRVEVWRPNGADTQGSIVLNPNEGRAPAQAAAKKSEAEEQAERNPFLPGKSRNPADAQEQSATSGSRSGDGRVKPLQIKPAEPEAPAPNPEPASPEPAPEPKPEPKPVTPKPQTPPPSQQKPKDVIDNLF